LNEPPNTRPALVDSLLGRARSRTRPSRRVVVALATFGLALLVAAELLILRSDGAPAWASIADVVAITLLVAAGILLIARTRRR
jgi:peptidoglycan/LPS O-acetylase OafA/YrhL